MRFTCSKCISFVSSFYLSLFAVNIVLLYNASRTKNTSVVICNQSPAVETIRKYNLMEETFGSNWAKESADKTSPYCTLEYANTFRLQQDHPCVIRLIRESYLQQPAQKNQPYNMNHSDTIDPSDGQSKEILRLLGNKTNGFFVECGAFDGEFLSNTLYMERSLDWSGLLIEADTKVFKQLLSRNRKAFTSAACLSTKPFPMEVDFNGTVGAYGTIIEEKGRNQLKSNSSTDQKNQKHTENIYKKQCFPLYSILLAIGKTDVDYFGLDVEGSEYKILKTIPWHKVNIKTVTAEWNHVPEGEEALTYLMESNKFTLSGLISNFYTREVIYIQNLFNVYRDQ